jgi:hypothetical protein
MTSRKAAIIAIAINAEPGFARNRSRVSPTLNRYRAIDGSMAIADQQARLEEAFDRIEETILPCIAMMLESLLDASEEVGKTDPKALAAELKILAAELEELTRAVERSSPVHLEPGEYKTAVA